MVHLRRFLFLGGKTYFFLDHSNDNIVHLHTTTILTLLKQLLTKYIKHIILQVRTVFNSTLHCFHGGEIEYPKICCINVI